MEDIVNTINQINELLDAVGETFWNQKLRSIRDQIVDQKKIKYCDLVKELFGGMGSLNDLYICEENGYNVNQNQELVLNEKLRLLIEQLFEQCS